MSPTSVESLRRWSVRAPGAAPAMIAGRSSALAARLPAQAITVDCASARSMLSETYWLSRTPPNASRSTMEASSRIRLPSIEKSRKAQCFIVAPKTRIGAKTGLVSMLGARDQQTLQLWSTAGPRGVIAQRDDWAGYARSAGQGNCEVSGPQPEPREKGGIAAPVGIFCFQGAEDV